ncbi:copper resistance system multicopper oxidase [Sphingomonas koreensis]|jgi:CopA family copper-resistance protein|uniref:Copper resistance system multicopper oxidase n=1 Tax=Sphingomonas koreensis TaxID=93064 RepID=A0A1L6JB31_9SPHN|nr:copper resistance system multicopper oxidase [Sphingomonas koreensis]APR53149.1 copper-binding protein [Sphingomonas koreensis]RSU24725.1 copper resistance system multicopper oxidase [Sphingomonas koreensis]RSU24969.1 copper resistance system multicopper oxidase [Sphingomonas koreensis]RSU27005.1 copper resistance system multicopper oxidase [Sphingomonas koreensis]RSU32840.1 copper resistance system multicopper oxidase [Sphingomonas koreensis]
MRQILHRRQLLHGAALAGSGIVLSAWLPAWAQSVSTGLIRPLPTVSGEDITLKIARQTMMIDGRRSQAIGINGTVPAPLIRLREGQNVRLHVVNDLEVDSSIHWHGLLVPPEMDGVPGVSFPGIRPRSTFIYEFPVRQSGTYWYHSHSGFQEQLGHYGPIVIDPAGTDPIASEREHVVVLSDHSFTSPEAIFRNMKLQAGYYNYQKQTLAGLLARRDQPLKERIDWGKMRMDPTDISDATGAAYTYLVNGHGPKNNWTALFAPGERVRLRIINASAMTTFNVRIPGLKLSVVQADGQNVRPVEVEEFQIGVAETFDVIVQPTEDRAYTLVGESVDRSGMARATLAPREGMTADIPPLRERTIATMKDMGMDMPAMEGMDMSGGASMPRGIDPTAEQNPSANLATTGAAAMPAMSGMNHSGDMAGMDHGATGGKPTAQGDMPGMAMGPMKMRDFSNAPQVRRGPGVQTISPMPADRTGEPGQGLANAGHRVLVYKDLMALDRNPDVRAPSRSLDIHLTGNMERFMWSFDGVKMSEAHAPFPFIEGERVRVNLINDSMMGHPIHLHGHFFELVTGHGDHAPRKHTVVVQPGSKVTFDFTADAVGDWAFHCHLLFHMTAGMMRTVSVRPAGAET